MWPRSKAPVTEPDLPAGKKAGKAKGLERGGSGVRPARPWGSGDAARWRHLLFLHLHVGEFKHHEVFVRGFKERRIRVAVGGFCSSGSSC